MKLLPSAAGCLMKRTALRKHCGSFSGVRGSEHGWQIR